MRRLFQKSTAAAVFVQLLTIAGFANGAAVENIAASWSTDWSSPQAIIVAPGTLTIPYVEQAQLGPSPIGTNDNCFGTTTATWTDADTAWLVASAPDELDYSGAVYVFSRAIGTAAWHQEARLTASDGMENEGFGSSVAISQDIVVVGAPSHKIGSIPGAVYTYVRDTTTGVWSQRGDAMGVSTVGGFGVAVALDGDTLAVGAPATATSGHVYVYQNSGTAWTILGSLTPSDSPAGAYFGGSLALNAGRLLIGAQDDSTFATDEGSAYVFAYQSATNSWEQQQKLIPFPDGAASDRFGTHVGLVGQMAVVAAPGRNSDQGAVDLFAFDSGHSAWIEDGVLQGPDGPHGGFGNTMALSANLLAVAALGISADSVYLYTTASGTATFQSKLPANPGQGAGEFGESISWSDVELLISDPYDDLDSEYRGTVHAFSAATMGWIERQPIVAMGDQNENFGAVTAVSGNVAVIKAAYQTDWYGAQGAADIYSRDANGNWQWQQKLSDNFGGPIAIDGNTLLIGAPAQAFGDNYDQGAAYIYVKSGDTWTQQAEIGDLANGKARDLLGTAVALSGDTALISAPGIDDSAGCVFVYVRTGTTWTRQAKLTVTDTPFGLYTGGTVALRGNIALIQGPYVSGDPSAVYVFERSGTTWTQKKKLLSADVAAGDEFALSLALSDNAAFVGADQKQIGTNYGQGRVYVFSGSDWDTQSTIDSPAGTSYGHFGTSIAVDGKRLIIGESGQNSAYLFYSDRGNWSLQSSLMDVPRSYFGVSVAASNGTVLVGASVGGNGSTPGGRAYVFQDDRIFADGLE